MNPREVAGLASTRTYPLRSSFRPSYNMAVNLVHQFGRETSRELLEQSFAQFQADRRWSAWPGSCARARRRSRATARRRPATWATSWSTPACAAGSASSRRARARPRRADRREEALESLAQLKPGDVIEVPAGKFAGYAVVVDPGYTPGGPAAVRRDRRPAGPAAGDDRLPDARRRARPGSRSPSPSTAATRRCAATWPPRCAAAPTTSPRRRRPSRRRQDRTGSTPRRSDREIGGLRADLKAHPCHACPDREDHARWAERYFKLDRDAATLKRRVERRTNTVARQFDRVCEVLTTLGYLETDGADTTRDRAGPAPDAALLRARPGRRRVPAPRAVGRPVGLRARGGRCRSWSSRRGDRTTRRRPGCPVAGSSGWSPRW